jgi:sialate O-acetylesterase
LPPVRARWRAVFSRRGFAGSARVFCWSLIVAAGWTVDARANVELAPLFRDHAVLQREQPVPVWGHAAPGEAVRVSFHGREVQTTAGEDRRWSVLLEPMSANGEGADLVVSGANTIALHDVVVGDVWLCSGQSNMAFSVARAQNAEAEMAAANFPLIREIAVRRQVVDTPATDVETTGWRLTTPENVRGFTAVGYFFAREIHQKTGVPIGLVHSSYGGTRIEAWMSAAAFARDPGFARTIREWRADNVVPYEKRKAEYDAALKAWQDGEAAAKAAGDAAARAFRRDHPRPSAPMTPQQGPSVLFNGMINPLVPYALRGVLWYQGESNAWAPSGDRRPAEDYRRQFPALIETWREHFGRPDLPFYWVQIAAYGTSHDWPTLRESQTLTLALPHTGQALAIDVGDEHNIHPRNKQEVGHRLALIARAKTYGEDVEFSGPVLRSAEDEGRAWRLRFDHAKGGLVARGGDVTSLEVAGADRVFHPATARIEGDTLIVSSAEVSEPAAVRYAWRNYPAANLYNTDGLPATPFRTDNW